MREFTIRLSKCDQHLWSAFLENCLGQVIGELYNYPDPVQAVSQVVLRAKMQGDLRDV